MFVIKIEFVTSNERLLTLLSTGSVCCSVLVAASQTLTVLSPDADASSFESCEKATDLTQLLCPSSVCCSVPVATSQTLTVLSDDADASSFESCEKTAEKTELLCPSSVCRQA